MKSIAGSPRIAMFPEHVFNVSKKAARRNRKTKEKMKHYSRRSDRERRAMFARMKDTAKFWPSLYKKNKGRFYRGTSGGKSQGFGALGAGLYVTWEKGIAKAFGKDVATYELPKDLKLLDAQSKTFIDLKAKMGFKPWEYSDDPTYARALKMMVEKKGYDGVISDELAEGLVVFDDKKVRKVSLRRNV
jgi:hypothetical protein